MQEVDVVISRFPGPVSLYMARRKRLVVFPLASLATAFCVWVLFAKHPVLNWGEIIAVAIVTLFCGWMAANAAVLLRNSSRGCLTLDAEGFEIVHAFWSVRSRWRDVSEFSVKRFGGLPGVTIGDWAVTYMLPGAPFGSRLRVLLDNYGLTDDQLAVLMNAWRARAIGPPA